LSPGGALSQNSWKSLFRAIVMNLRKSVILGLTLFGLLPACGPNRDLIVSSPPLVPPSPIEKEIEKEEERRTGQDLIVLLPESDGKVGKIRVTTEGNSQVIDRPWFGVQVEESGKRPLTPQPMGESEVQNIFGTALEVYPDLPNRFVSVFLWFESDQIKLTPESRKSLKEIVKTIKNRKSTEIYVAGHTDRVGTEAHNLKLSSKRAFYVRDFLVANGIKSGGFVVSYHGETMPLVPTEDEAPEPSNRRVEVFIK
jgi:outer membrane protein OmpA-like peptidoglycan-associated protein